MLRPQVVVLERAGHLPILRPLKLDRRALAQKLCPVALHVPCDVLGDLLVEPPEEDGPSHDVGLESHGGEEAGRLEGDVRGADDEGLAGGAGEGEGRGYEEI